MVRVGNPSAKKSSPVAPRPIRRGTHAMPAGNERCFPANNHVPESPRMHITRLFPIAVFILIAWLASPAAAVLQFYKVFQVEYLDHHPDQEFATFAKKPVNRCFVCHQGKDRKNHNEYGDHLVEILDRKSDAKDTDKILAALKKVEMLPVDPNDEQGETYRERILAGKWPGGELDDLKKELPEDEELGDER
jgi:uncharacterized membrane protein